MTNPLDHIEKLCDWFRATNIGLLELNGPTGTLRLFNAGSSVQIERVDGPEPTSMGTPTMAIRAPSPGILLDHHPLHERAIACVGDDVQAGELLGFLQVGPLLTPVPALEAGRVSGVFVEHGTIVGYGTPLFELQLIEGERLR
jgi:acetyl-CoA carboxylase biotin carboxyl carrier protein